MIKFLATRLLPTYPFANDFSIVCYFDFEVYDDTEYEFEIINN